MTTKQPEPIDAIAAWVESNSQRIKQDAMLVTLQIGHVPDRSRRKVGLSLRRDDKVALVEAWSSGEIDFTTHDFSINDKGHIKHCQCTTFEDFQAAIENFYFEFTNK